MAPNRREFLATGAAASAAVIGGCSGCGQVDTATVALYPETDAGIGKRVVAPAASFETVTPPTSVDPPEAYGDANRLAARAVVEGSATVEAFGDPPVPAWEFVGRGVYRIETRPVSRRVAVAYRVTVDPVGFDQTVTPDDRTPVAELPAVDRRALREAGLTDAPAVETRVLLPYPPERVGESVLVPEPATDAVVLSDRAVTLGVGERESGAFTTYRITADRVTDPARFGALVRRTVGFQFVGLPEEQREILAEGVVAEPDDEPFVLPPGKEPTAAVRRLAGRFETHEAVGNPPFPSDEEGYVLEWRGDRYWADATFGFDEVLTARENW